MTLAPPRLEPDAPARAPVPPADAQSPPRAPALRTSIAAALATAGAGWMAGGLFAGVGARAVGVGGALLGAAIVALSYRTQRPSIVQYLALPAAMLVGALLVLPDAGGGVDVPGLVAQALRGGGLAQPPLPFDPGWRFLLVVLTTVVGAAAAGAATALDRPKLAIAVPVPLILGAALIQPPSGELVSSTVAIALALGGLGVSYGGELAAAGTTTGRGFELKRIGRGVALLGALVVAIVALSRARFLFPATTSERVVPPTRPTASAPQPDRVLFRAYTPSPGPWRLGVLDVYDGLGWLFPPYDTSRLVGIEGGEVRDERIPVSTEDGTIETRFEVLGLEGRTVPAPANAVRIEGLGDLQYDPRTQGLRLAVERARAGLAYTVEAPEPPTGAALADAPAPPAWARPFLEAPPPPNEVVALLRRAPDTNAWDRLQFVRARLYARVVAAGAGTPIDVPPARVVDLLAGGEGTPWEITAAEALLARWAGVPARIGFGFYAGDRRQGTPFAEVRPRHGATWLEVYFHGQGWVPIVGVPPRARSSLSPDEQNENPNVLPTDELALIVHVPIRLQTVTLLYVTIRYWLGVAIPILAALALAWWAMPGALKLARRLRRARWARARGPAERVAAAYAELRDRCADLGIVSHALPPLAFADAQVAADDEHGELAWLVTRALWGDMTERTTDADAAAADELARSVARRIARAQAMPVRVLAFGSRASLREPYAPELPNVWPAWLDRRPVRSFVRARLASIRRRRRARKLARAATACLLLVLASCAQGYDASARYHAGALPAVVVPARAGDVTLRREPDAEEAYARAGAGSLVRDGRVYTMRRGPVIEGYVQVMALLPSVDVRDPTVRTAVLRSIAAGRFRLRRVGEERVWVQDLPEQRMLAWFTPDAATMYLQVTRRAYPGAETAFLQIVRAVKGTGDDAENVDVTEWDPRRGGEA